MDVTLEVGNVNDAVSVTSEVPLVETTNASTGQLISADQLEELPNMGRSPFNEAVKLSQNIVPGGDPRYNRMEDQTGSSQISIGGGPVQGNNYILDGISISNTLNYAVIIPTVEAVAEVKVQVNTYDAEIGRSGGGTFNVLLKSGTNQLHGTLLGNMWIQSLLANNFFNNAAGRNASGALNKPIAVPTLLGIRRLCSAAHLSCQSCTTARIRHSFWSRGKLINNGRRLPLSFPCRQL